MLRKRALDDVAELTYSGDWPIRRYIRDRTVIEDTESTIDLTAHGWTVYNYPERLSYSATPPDFGSLCIQRHRWANGGLLIVPKLFSSARVRRAAGQRPSLGEMFLRLNYMASIFWSSISVLFLMVFPFNGHLLTPLTLIAAVPYFVAMTLDLRYCGYKTFDIARLYGFNLLLLPVNLAGTLSSIVQAVSGTKGSFRRTPKVRNRTDAGAHLRRLAVRPRRRSRRTPPSGPTTIGTGRTRSSPRSMPMLAAVRDPRLRRSCAIRSSTSGCNVVSWLRKPPSYAPAPSRSRAPATGEAAVADWELVLYLGFADRRRAPRDAAEVTAAPEPPPGRESAPKRNGSITGLPHRHGVASYGLGVIGETD